MANVDTGLGWSAEASYLTSEPGAIGSLTSMSSPLFTDGPLPVYEPSNGADVVAHGKPVFYDSSQRRTMYMCASQNFVFPFLSGGTVTADGVTGGTLKAVARYMGVSVRYWKAYRSESGSISSATYSWISSNYNSDIRYGGDSGNSGYTGAKTLFIPQLASMTDAAASFTISDTSYYKLNGGPAVVCFVNWKDTVQTAWSPVVISTVESNTKLSTDGTSESGSSFTSIVRYNGMRFFMTYIRGSGIPDDAPFPRIDVSSVVVTLQELFRGIAGPSYANILVTETVDPYDPFGNTGEDGGDPDPNPKDDDIEEEDLPTLSFSSAGFARIYRPNLQQINDLADYMWTDQTFLQTVINHLKQLLENPMDAVISLGLVPCVPPVGADVPVKVMFVNTRVEMPPVTNQFVKVDCGSFTLKEMYGSALDYNPYTKVQLYLPYVGTVKLDTDEVMGKTLQVKYNIDVVTGVCCAYVIAGGDVLYQFSGHCSINQPISSADFSSYINAAIAAAKVGIAAATGGASAAAGAAASGIQAPAPAVGGGSSVPALPPSTSMVPASQSSHFTSPAFNPDMLPHSSSNASSINFAELAKPGNINTVASAMGGKVEVMHSGGFGGNSGYLAAVRRPYLIVTRPRIANPQQYGQFNGRPSMMYLNLGSCTGYTQVQSVYLTGFDATNPELAEISELLKGGVVL